MFLHLKGVGHEKSASDSKRAAVRMLTTMLPCLLENVVPLRGCRDSDEYIVEFFDTVQTRQSIRPRGAGDQYVDGSKYVLLNFRCSSRLVLLAADTLRDDASAESACNCTGKLDCP